MISSENRANPRNSIAEHFSTLDDPRVVARSRHRLLDLVTIAILAIICGAEGWTEIEEFGKARRDWLSSFLELRSGIPIDDTFRRLFSKLNPKSFERCFQSWVQAVVGSLAGKLLAIDGKSSRGSSDPASGTGMLHLVHAWVAENQILLGQVETQAKSNEITAIPELLALLDLKGAIVTIDAAGCQKEIAKQIVEQKADYVLSLKNNHPTFHREVVEYFEHAKENMDVFTSESTDGEHGRIEVRRVFTTNDVQWFSEKKAWAGLNSFILVESEREEKGKKSSEQRVYISSLDARDAKTLSEFVRGHWSVENQLHWMLDVAFREDASRVRKDHAPRNFSLMRKIALMMLKNEKTSKRGIAVKRKRAGWDNDYLLKVISAGVKDF